MTEKYSPALLDRFESDYYCRAYLVGLKWPNGIECPRCHSSGIGGVAQQAYICNSCSYRFSVTAGSVLHNSHLSLTKWFVATYIMVECSKNVSANQMRHVLGICYKTAWYLCHRIRKVMNKGERVRLSGAGWTEANKCQYFKRAIISSHRKVSDKHLGAYLGELQWRVKHDSNPYLFRDTLINLLSTSRMEYKELIGKLPPRSPRRF